MAVVYQNLARFFLFLRLTALLLFALVLSCVAANCQAIAETAGATSVSATTAVNGIKPLPFPNMPTTSASMSTPSSQGSSPHLIASSGPPAEVKNRQALEQKAGTNAGKLLLRSVPTGANVWIDSAYVGKTPMLLILAPGKYHVQLRDQRQDYAEGNVDLLPRETREFVPALTVRYPIRATVR